MRQIAFLLAFLVTWPLARAEIADSALLSTRHTNGVPAPIKLVEGPSDANIVRLVTQILQRQHYSQMKLTDEVSSKFFDRYLDSLDNLHLFFIQSDLDEFEKYRYQLDTLSADKGDTTPGRLIFTRFRQRLAQQYDYALELLKNEKFDFTGSDRFILDRKKLPRPRDLTEARQLWRDRLRYEYLQEKLNKEKHDDIVKKLTKRYTQVTRMLNEYDNDDMLQIYLTALAHVYDPHSDYMIKSELENFSIGMKLSLYGIGAKLQSEDGLCKIVELTPASPAEKSKKLKAGDKIVAVAQSNQPPVEVVDMKLNRVVDLIRGAKDTEVRLTVVPVDDPSARKIVSIIRDEIKLEESAAKARIFEMPSGKDTSGKEQSIRLGVVDLPSFYSGFELEGRRGSGEQKSTTTDVAKLLRKLMQENVTGVVLDLRRNGGGSLEEAINLTGLFIKEGPVVQVRGPDGKVFVDADPEPTVYYDGPLVVLTSRFSASASEILAGALQDYGRALVVGDNTTHGKGTVQSLLQLAPIMRQHNLVTTNNPGALKFTIRKFYRASGASTQLKGVVPDIILPSVANLYEVGESSLDNPLPWDTIEPATYERVDRVEPYLSELKKRSDQRIASDQDFAYIYEEMGRYKKMQAEKSVSLNEEVRIKEKKEADDRAKARKKNLAARPEPLGRIYDLTLKLADEPGLPPPTVRTNNTASTSSTVTNTTTTVISPNTETVSSQTSTVTNSAKGIQITKKSVKDSANSSKTGKAESPASAENEEENEPEALPVDPTLDETRRILVDYIQLLAKRSGVAATKPNN